MWFVYSGNMSKLSEMKAPAQKGGNSFSKGRLKILLAAVAIIIVVGIVYAVIIGMGNGGNNGSAGKVKVDYFYSETCPACIQQKPVLDEFIVEFADLIDFEKKCIPVHQGDDQLCINIYGNDKYASDVTEAQAKGVSNTPTFFFNNQKVVGLQTKAQLKNYVCSALYGLFSSEEKAEQCR